MKLVSTTIESYARDMLHVDIDPALASCPQPLKAAQRFGFIACTASKRLQAESAL